MSVLPVFEIGLWNAWIFMLIHSLPSLLIAGVQREWSEQSMKSLGRESTTALSFAWVLWVLAFGYSIFLPLRTGTWWFSVGFPIALVGVVTYLLGIVPLITTPLDERPATTGTYRYSRHPMYVTQLVMFVGVGIAAASWLFLLVTMTYGGMCVVYAPSEEDICLERYGNAYRDYRQRTPRWLGLPKPATG